MVRACQADEHISEYLEGLLRSRSSPEVGLLIGKRRGSTRDLLLGVVATPSTDGILPIQVHAPGPASSTPVSRAGGKKATASSSSGPAGGSSLTLDADWISEHGRQVSCMLAGGMSVLGLYLFCPEAAWQASSLQLMQLLAALHTGAAPAPAAPTPFLSAITSQDDPAALGDALLLHADSASRKQTLRVCSTASLISGSMQPLELKYVPLLPSLVQLQASHTFCRQLPLTSASTSSSKGSSTGSLAAALHEAVAAECKRIRSGMLVLSGTAPAADKPLADALAAMQSAQAAAGSSSSKEPIPNLQAHLYVPPGGAACRPVTDCGQTGSSSGGSTVACSMVAGMLTLQGTVHGLAFAHKREPCASAADELKNDLVCSLHARVEVLIDEARAAAREDDEDEGAVTAQQAQQQQQQQHPGACGSDQHPLLARSLPAAALAYGLPRRVWVPWQRGLLLSDYCMEGEGLAAAVERSGELIMGGSSSTATATGCSMQAAYDAEQEACPPVPTHTRLWHPWMQQQDSGTSAVSGVKQAAQAAAGGGGGGAGRPAYSSTCILAVVGSLGAALGAVCIGMMGSD